MPFINEEDIDRLLGKIKNQTQTSSSNSNKPSFYKTNTSHANINKNEPHITPSVYRTKKQAIKTMDLSGVHSVRTIDTLVRKSAKQKRETFSTTTQATYKTAPFSLRFMAFLVDLSIIFIFTSTVLIVLYKFFALDSTVKTLSNSFNSLNFFSLSSGQIILLTIILSLFLISLIFYFALSELLFNQTLGKAVFNIIIVDKKTLKKPNVIIVLLRSLLFFATFPFSIFGIHNLLTNTTLITK